MHIGENKSFDFPKSLGKLARRELVPLVQKEWSSNMPRSYLLKNLTFNKVGGTDQTFIFIATISGKREV